MNNDNILGTGLSGLVGSRIIELMPEYTFEDLSRKTGTDITNKESLLEQFNNSSAPYVLHLAAYTNVDAAEAEKNLGNESESWKINVGGTENVIAACEATGKKLIYISTDMVFNGEKPLGESYTEEDTPDPKNWYAMTKYEAEKQVKASSISWTIVRIAYPYRAHFEKKEYVRVFLNLLQENKPFTAITDHYFTPTFIDDLPSVFRFIINNTSEGIFHAGGAQTITPYDVAIKIAQVFNLNASLIGKTTQEEYFKNKAHRGFNLSLNNGKINTLGIHVKSFDQGLEEIKKQLA